MIEDDMTSRQRVEEAERHKSNVIKVKHENGVQDRFISHDEFDVKVHSPTFSLAHR